MLSTELIKFGRECRSIAFKLIRQKRELGYDGPQNMFTTAQELKEKTGAVRIHLGKFAQYLRSLGAIDVMVISGGVIHFSFPSELEKKWPLE
jgi:hypothetical protein